MPPQSPACGVVSGLLLVAPPIVASLYDVKVTGLVAVPSAWRALPWFCTKSEAFSSLRVEPAWKTRVVLNGTEALPLVTTELPAGASSTKLACDDLAGGRVALRQRRLGHDDDRLAGRTASSATPRTGPIARTAGAAAEVVGVGAGQRARIEERRVVQAQVRQLLVGLAASGLLGSPSGASTG